MRYQCVIKSAIVLSGVVVMALLGLAACQPLQPPVVVNGSPVPSVEDTATPPAATVATRTPAPTASAVPTKENQEATMPAMPTAPTPSSPTLERLVALAKEDLSRRLSVDASQIDLLEVQSVVWPDASLGCPQPGMRYKQVPQDGALIVLDFEGQVYEYHSGGGRDPFLCEKTAPASKPTPLELDELPPTAGSENE